MSDEFKNNTILLVDDEADILSSCENMLKTHSEDNAFLNIAKNRANRNNLTISADNKKDTFRILLADSGEKAIEIVAEEASHGRQIAAGFFDMVMPKGIDGIETIKAIKKLDKDMLCAIVTAYTDRSPEEISSVFESPSEWIYFNKPFTKGELRQCVNNMLALWNLKRKEEVYLRMLEVNNCLLSKQKDELTNMVEIKTKDMAHQQAVLTAQYEFANRLNSLKDIDSIIDNSLRFIENILHCERISIMLEEDGLLKIKGSIGIDPEISKSVCVPIGMGISGTVFKNKHPVIIKDVSDIKNFNKLNEGGSSFISSPMMLSPIGIKDEAIGVINVTNKKADEPFNNDDMTLLTYISNTSSIAISNHMKTVKLEQAYLDIIMTMVQVIEAKDPYTKGHSERVKEYSHGIAIELGLSKDKINILDQISLLHDIGKIWIPENIINKAGKLTEEEYNIIKNHSIKGFEMIKHLSHLKSGHSIVKHHHERVDGKGYPDGITMNDIELEARIIAVADTFDAMTSTRSYRPAMDKWKAIKELEACSGTQLDKDCVDAFLRYLRSKEIIP